MQYSKSIKIKNLYLKNRLVLPPMATYTADENGFVTSRQLEFYGERAKSGVGLIILEHCFINNEGRADIKQLSLASDSAIEGLNALVETIHSSGTKVIAQINHVGSAGRSPTHKSAPEGPSSIINPTKGLVRPKEMTIERINKVINDFCSATERVVKAGFDGVEIHGAHGFLINQFMSPLTNNRLDSYGVTAEGRVRIAIEIVQQIRKLLGREFPIFFRLAGDDRLIGGITINDACKYALALVNSGVDVIDVSGGFCGSRLTGLESPYFINLAQKIKSSVGTTVLVTGGIRSAPEVERIIGEKEADLVGIGRPLLKNPHWLQQYGWLE